MRFLQERVLTPGRISSPSPGPQCHIIVGDGPVEPAVCWSQARCYPGSFLCVTALGDRCSTHLRFLGNGPEVSRASSSFRSHEAAGLWTQGSPACGFHSLALNPEGCEECSGVTVHFHPSPPTPRLGVLFLRCSPSLGGLTLGPGLPDVRFLLCNGQGLWRGTWFSLKVKGVLSPVQSACGSALNGTVLGRPSCRRSRATIPAVQGFYIPGALPGHGFRASPFLGNSGTLSHSSFSHDGQVPLPTSPEEGAVSRQVEARLRPHGSSGS